MNRQQCVCGKEGIIKCLKCKMQKYCSLKCQNINWNKHKYFCEATKYDNIDDWYLSLFKGIESFSFITSDINEFIVYVVNLIEYWQCASILAIDKDDIDYINRCTLIISKIIKSFNDNNNQYMNQLVKELMKRRLTYLTCTSSEFDLLINNGYNRKE